jgi:hypothetical protein
LCQTDRRDVIVTATGRLNVSLVVTSRKGERKKRTTGTLETHKPERDQKHRKIREPKKAGN